MSERSETFTRRKRQITDSSGRLRLSATACHLDECSTYRLAQRTAEHVRLAVRSPAGVSVRTFCPVDFLGRRLLADVVTGSLYADGQCLSSVHRTIVADQAPAAAKRPRRRWSTAQLATGFANGRLRHVAA